SNSGTGSSGLVSAVMKKLNQAVTLIRHGSISYTKGHLENATNLMSFLQQNPKAGFKFVYPERKTYFATQDMLATLASVGSFNNANIQGYVTSVGDVSSEKGGELG